MIHCSRRPQVSIVTQFIVCAQYNADQDVHITEVQRLQRKPLFQIIGHIPKADAPDLFRPCSTQRLYIHGHPDFDEINEVTP